MFYWDKLVNDLADFLGAQSSDFTQTPDLSLGHLSLPLFNLAKDRAINPVVLAQEKAQQLNQAINWQSLIKEAKAVGPYLNIYLKNQENITGILKNILSLKSLYGAHPLSGQVVMVEFSNANTHKEVHVGHLRNISYGDSVVKMMKLSGRRSLPVSFINDFGIHVAKTVWCWENNEQYSNSSESKGFLLGKCYTEAVKKLGDDEQLKKEVSNVMKAIESRQGDWYQLWRQTRQWSIDYFSQVYKDLNIKFEKIFYESQLIDRGLLIVKDLLAKDILTTSQGAVIADLQSDNLGVMPIIRSDGTALYPVADLALSLVKFESYNLEESIYVIDNRQSLHFKQLFKILEKMGYQQKLTHLAYDFVKLKTGLMSSRSGNIITYQEIFNQAYNRAQAEVIARHPTWSPSMVKRITTKLAISALKFEMIKVSPDKIITFDADEALRFDGYTAAYLQYTGARINSILTKGLNIFSRLYFNFSAATLTLDSEIKLTLLLAQYPEKIRQSALSYNPSILSRYLFDLCQQFNDYYQTVNILKAAPTTRQARLALVQAINQVLKNGFKPLGINYLEKM